MTDYQKTGVMVALFPHPDIAKKISIKDGEDPEHLHVTLAFIGTRGEEGVQDNDDWPDLSDAVAKIAENHGPLAANVGGLARFIPGDDGVPFVAIVGAEGIHELQQELVDALKVKDIPVSEKYPFQPHMTLKYLADGEEDPWELEEPFDLGKFDKLVVKNGEVTQEFSLTGKPIEKSSSGGKAVEKKKKASSYDEPHPAFNCDAECQKTRMTIGGLMPHLDPMMKGYSQGEAEDMARHLKEEGWSDEKSEQDPIILLPHHPDDPFDAKPILWDGNHRVWAASLNGWDDQEVPVHLHGTTAHLRRPLSHYGHSDHAEGYPTGPDYGNEDQSHPVLYRVTHPRDREAIEREGMQAGHHAFDNEQSAREFADYADRDQPWDVWSYDAHNLHQQMDEGWKEVEGRDNDDAHYIPDAVPTERLHRLAAKERAGDEHKPEHEYVAPIGDVNYFIPKCSCGWEGAMSVHDIRSETATKHAWERHVVLMDVKKRLELAGEPRVDAFDSKPTKRWGKTKVAGTPGDWQVHLDNGHFFSLYSTSGEVTSACGKSTIEDNDPALVQERIDDQDEDPRGYAEDYGLSSGEDYVPCYPCKGTGKEGTRPPLSNMCGACQGSGIQTSTRVCEDCLKVLERTGRGRGYGCGVAPCEQPNNHEGPHDFQKKSSKEYDFDDFDTPNHDYDPSWDYKIDEDPHPSVVAAVDKVKPKLEETARHLGMGRPSVHYVNDIPGDAVATYANGTAPHAVLMVDAKRHESDDPEDSEDLDWNVHTSLFHEFGHAIEDWMGDQPDEDRVEDFSRETVSNNHIKAAEKFMERYKDEYDLPHKESSVGVDEPPYMTCRGCMGTGTNIPLREEYRDKDYKEVHSICRFCQGSGLVVQDEEEWEERNKKEGAVEGVSKRKLDIPISDSIHHVLTKLNERGSKGLVVGGAVRDAMMGETPKDIDIEVYGKNYEDLSDTLKEHGKVNLVGKAFGVIKFKDREGNDYDFSLPRRDNTTGIGHKDFSVEFDPDITPKEAASRRDFTFNSMAYDPMKEELHDYFGGEKDLNDKVIRHTSDAFSEDPLRVLRGMQFSSRFGMDIHPDTAALSDSIKEHYATIPKERVSEEFMKLATKGKEPGKAIDYLKKTGWIDNFPALKSVVDVPQEPAWHPEGSVDVHVGHAMNAAAKVADREGLTGDDRATIVLGALCHDLGKATHTQTDGDKITSYGHDSAGGPISRDFLSSIGIKKDITDKVVPLVENHMQHLNFEDKVTPRVIRRLAQRIQPASIKELSYVMEADHSGRPPLEGGMPEGAKKMVEQSESNHVEEHPQEPLIKGRHVLPYFNNEPGKHIGDITNEAYEHQLNGDINTPEEADEWLKKRLSNVRKSMNGFGDIRRIKRGIRKKEAIEPVQSVQPEVREGSFDRFIEAVMALAGRPQPEIHVDIQPQQITINVPEQQPPTVQVAAPIINIPEQKAPIISIPEQPAPIVHVNIPETPARKVKKTVKRDKEDNISEIIEEEV